MPNTKVRMRAVKAIMVPNRADLRAAAAAVGGGLRGLVESDVGNEWELILGCESALSMPSCGVAWTHLD